jgi:hypothetical protein
MKRRKYPKRIILSWVKRREETNEMRKKKKNKKEL